MTHRMEQLIDLQAVRNLLASYYNLTGISCTLFDTDQNLLVAEGWQDICSHFHRQHPVSALRCKRSNAKMLCPQTAASENCREYRCENGMLYLSLPVMVDALHLGTLVIGKFFYDDEPLDRTFFAAQATELGFDQTHYFTALEQVPVFQRDYVCRNVQLLDNMVSMLATTGLANLRLEDRTQKLQHANRQQESANRALRLLSASNQTLLRSSDEEKLLFQVCTIAVEVGGYTTAWVGLALHDEDKSVIPLAWYGIEEGFLDGHPISWEDNERGATAMATAIRTGTVQTRQDILHDPTLSAWHNHARKYNFQSSIALPLRVDGEIIGALAIYATEPDAFQQDEVALLQELVGDLAFGIETIRMRRAHERTQQQIRQLAYFDHLTGLPNQFKFKDRLERTVTAALAEQQSFSLLLLDLTLLREINENHGHTLGDQVIVRISRQLLDVCGHDCFVARFGGDFAVIYPYSGQDAVMVLAEKILAAITPPFYLSGHRLQIGGSIGMAVFPGDGETASELLSKADLATSRAKAAGGGFCFYRPEMGEQLARSLQLARCLEHAIQHNRLQLFYQTKIDLLQGQLVGAEALLRWHDQEHGWISPVEFVSVAETRGMMLTLGAWVLRTACCQIRQWQNEGYFQSGRIAVNISARQLEDSNFPVMLSTILAETGVAPQFLELELTESILMSDPERITGILAELKSQGFSLAIDDFGTGYSSLAYLKKFPVDTLKIDRAFVRDMLDNHHDRAIVATITAMAQQLGLTTVAEGIELEGQHYALLELGCLQGQGFHFSRPKPPDLFKEKWLSSQ